MGKGVPVATMSVLIEADIAPLQKGMQDAGSSVRGAFGGIKTEMSTVEAVTAAAGRSMSQLARMAQALQDEIDPLAPVIRRYRQALADADAMLATNKITQEQHARAVEMAGTKYEGARRAALGLPGAMNAVTVSAGAQRAGMQQLGMQLGDMATMYALGAKPMQIFASQSSQVLQAITLMSNGTSKFATFLSGPWGIAITVATIALTPFIGSLFQSEKALKAAQFASYGLRDAQGILGGVMDLTTGKITTQSAALHGLAKAQALAMQVQARARQAEAGRTIQDARDAHWQWGGSFGGGISISKQRGPAAGIVTQFQSGDLTAEATVKRLDDLRKASKLTEQQFLDLAAAVANFGVEGENIKVAEQLEKALNGDTQAIQSFLKVAEHHKTAAEARAETLAREAAATEALINGLHKVADAYLESSAAGMRAEIEAKAIEQGMRKRADIDAFVSQQLRKATAERIAQGAQTIAAMREETAVRVDLNDKVAAGTLTIDAATRVEQMAAQLRPLQIAALAAEGEQREKLTKIIEEMMAALDAEDRAQTRSRDLSQSARIKEQIADVELETRLTNELGAARLDAMRGLSGGALEDELARLSTEHEKAAIQAKAEAEAARLIKDGYVEAAAGVLKKAEADKTQVDAAAAIERQAKAIQTLKDMADGLDLSKIFGRGADAIDGMRDSLERLSAAQRAHKVLVEAAGGDQAKIAKADSDYTRAKINGVAALIGSTKSFFKEQSTGYKVMAAAEKAFAMVQLAHTAIDVAAGAAKMFSFLGPFAFPAVAAMMAVMAGLGFKGAGGGGSYRPPSAEEVQAAQGTGSVLGDSKAKSGSIGNALDLMLKNSNKDLEYSNEMVRSLRAIEGNIGALSSLLARQLDVSGGAFDQSGLGLGSSTKVGTIGTLLMPLHGLLDDIPVIGGLLSGIAKALFGTKKTVTLLDQGLTFAAQSVEDILNGGIVGQVYQDVQTQTKKKFFGITTSNKTKVTTSYGELDNDMERQIALIVGSLRAGIIDAAGVLGLDGAAATLDAFKVELGKISIKDLKGDEIQAALEAVFSKLGDDMASAVLPGLATFQRVGEGTFETLARLAKDYATLDTALTSIGMTFGAVGLASVAARESLIELFGGLDAFSEQTAFFRENFLSEAEQMAPVITAVNAEMARLGVASVKTKDQFKDLVLGLDLSTESGSEMYASLMAVAPAFAKVIEYLGSLDGALGEGGKTAEELAAIAKQRRGLEIDLMDALGQSEEALAARRADALAALDDSLKPLQEQVWAAQDAATANAKLAQAQADAAAAAKALADQRRGLEGQILQLLGDTEEIRRRELATLDESLRPLQERIYALQDEAEAAAAAKAIADQRLGLEGQILQLLGDTEEIRRRELATLDESLRPLQERIYALQDEAEAMAKAKAVADERYGLETQLYQALGDTATLRARDLAGLDESNRALQQRIWAIEDQKVAEEAAAQARQSLIDGYRSEASALGETAEKFRNFAKTIAEFRDGLLATSSGVGGFAQIEAQFQRTAAMARLGNEASLSAFTTDAKAYLDAATARAGSRDDVQLALARVIAASNGAIGGANGMADMASAQLAAAEAAAAQLETLNGTAGALDAALGELKAQQSEEVVPAVTETVETSVGKLREEVVRLREEAADREEQMISILTAMTVTVSRLQRDVAAVVDGDMVMVGTREGDPLEATVTGNVTVDNTAANPVPVDTTP